MFPQIMYQYHDTILAGHQGVMRMHQTLKRKFFTPGMIGLIRQYANCCHECQTRKPKEKIQKAHFERIPEDFRPMRNISCDVKYMPLSSKGFKFLLLVTCDISNYVVGIPMHLNNSISIAEALLNRVVYTYGCPEQICMDEDKALTAEVVMHLYNILCIKPIIVSPENHGSLRTERYIRTISEMLCKYLTDRGEMWHLYVNACCYAHNTFASTALKYSPFEIVFLKPPPDLTTLTFDPFKGQTKTIDEYMKLLKDRFDVIRKLVTEKRIADQQQQLINQQRTVQKESVLAVGDLVYLFAPTASALKAPSRKFKQDWIGPLQIQAVLDETHYMVADLEGQTIPAFGTIHRNRLRVCFVNLGVIHGKKLATISNSKHLLQELHKLEIGDY